MISRCSLEIVLAKKVPLTLLSDTAPSSQRTPSNAFKKSQPNFSMASCAGSAINDEAKGDGGGA